ncbi:MAG: lipoate--protein ligase family protein [bacterium]|nr:lipoate--protein ligase family protein [bacterium]
MSTWYLIEDKEPLPAAENMARDEYLFDLCHEKKMGFFRLYSWEKPSFSFGVSQKITKAVNLDFIEKNNGAFAYVRRVTGGKTVLHDDEITYSVVSSEDIFYRDNDLYRSYMLISTVLVNAFQAIGLNAYLSQGSPSELSKSNNPCFSFPTPNELEIDGKKIVGSAQKRDKQALVQHGSIPISMDYEAYAAGAHSRAAIIKRSMTTLSEVSGKVKQDLSEALIRSFQDFSRQTLEVFEFDRKDKQQIARLEKKYRSHEWNFRL